MSAHHPFPIVEVPSVPPARGYEGTATPVEIRPRYEDIAQNGCVQLTTMMPGLSAIWRVLGTSKQLETFRSKGILPILRRLIVVGEKGPFSVSAPIEYRGEWRLAREKEGGGDRLFINMWLEARAARAAIGSMQNAPPSRDAERVLVGRAFAEHVITRPFASSAAERKVTRIEGVPGLPELPEDVQPFEDADALIAGHEDALEPGSPHERLFAQMHTDSNQHVNSLVYPRLFEETVVKRMHEKQTVERPAELLARALEIRYRKPFFCGDRAIIACHVAAAAATKPQAEAETYRASAVGTFAPAEDPKKLSCAIAMWLA